MTKIIKDFTMFPTGSIAYNLSRELKSEEDIKQFLEEKEQEVKNAMRGLKNLSFSIKLILPRMALNKEVDENWKQ